MNMNYKPFVLLNVKEYDRLKGIELKYLSLNKQGFGVAEETNNLENLDHKLESDDTAKVPDYLPVQEAQSSSKSDSSNIPIHDSHASSSNKPANKSSISKKVSKKTPWYFLGL